MAELKAIITDLDGVLTDGGMIYHSVNPLIEKETFGPLGGERFVERGAMASMFSKRFHTRDAAAARWLHENTDVMLFVITAGDSPRNNAINAARMEVMYLAEPIEQAIADKWLAVHQIAKRHDLEFSEIVYIGDDRADLCVLGSVAVNACPRDALLSVRRTCNLVSCYDGGYGVLADVVDRLQHNGRIKEKKK